MLRARKQLFSIQILAPFQYRLDDFDIQAYDLSVTPSIRWHLSIRYDLLEYLRGL